MLLENQVIPNVATNRPSQTSLIVALFASTIFLGAFLLFQVQPIIGKIILPWFGGSPGVWTTCMLMFQLLLFAGYLYAHLLKTYFGTRWQVIAHIALLLVSLAALPIAPEATWKPNVDDSPVWLIALLLLCKVGAPYFLLSATGPLLQSWISGTKLVEKPYRLYSLSNVGSMLALISFPFVVEPWLSSTQQSSVWSIAFGCYTVLCILVALFVYQRNAISAISKPIIDASRTTQPTPKDSIRLDTWVTWMAYAALPSTMLLATTNQVCQDTAVIPFLWVIPLAIYLLSFILTFDSDRWYSRRPCIQFAAISYLILYGAKLATIELSLGVEISLYFIGLFFACMVCHGELVGKRPHPSRLTSFYLSISAGGAIGGLFVGLAAPVLFKSFYEFQLSLLCCLMLFMATYLSSNAYWRDKVPYWSKGLLATAIPVMAIVWLTFWNAKSNQQLVAKRNFYGVLSVTQGVDSKTGLEMRSLVHGRVVHGAQFLDDKRRLLPTAYFTESSGIGQLLSSLRENPLADGRKIGVVGLGAGTLASYASKGDRYRFYEINPHVIELAQDYFTFLSQSEAVCEVVTGDARLVLEREPNQNFDVLVLDAFSGDAIPVHLLTEQSMEIYCRHLSSEGRLAIHISNLYFNLQGVVQGLADSQNMHCDFVSGVGNAKTSARDSTWALLTPRNLQPIVKAENRSTKHFTKPIHWTDEKSNLFEVLK